MSIKIKLDYSTPTGELKTKLFNSSNPDDTATETVGSINNQTVEALDYIIKNKISQFTIKHITQTLATDKDLPQYKELLQSEALYRKSPGIFHGMKRKLIYDIITKNLQPTKKMIISSQNLPSFIEEDNGSKTN